MTDAEPRIVLEGMSVSERQRVIEQIAASGISEEIVVDGESERAVGELRADLADVVEDAREAGVPEDVLTEEI